MNKSRRYVSWLITAGCALLIVDIGACGLAAGMTAQRRPDAFVSYLRAYTDLDLSRDNQLIWLAYGEDACTWLAEQPSPWLSRANRFQHDSLTARYWRENPAPHAWQGLKHNENPKQFMVSAAWGRLCSETWELHEPHNPFNRRRTD